VATLVTRKRVVWTLVVVALVLVMLSFVLPYVGGSHGRAHVP